jgi:hypothetical protein
MATFYMAEGYPGFIMAEAPPAPGWKPALRKDRPQGTGGRSVAELGAALAAEVAKSRELRQQYAEQAPPKPTGADTPTDFVTAVDRLVKLGVSYGDACRRVSMEFPELYEAHRQWSMLDN